MESILTTRPKLLDRVRQAIRTRHYSYRTEEAYVGWIRRFILFHGKRHPAEMGKQEIERFLTSLAVERIWPRPVAARSRTEISGCGSRVGMAVGFPCFEDLPRCALWGAAALSSARIGPATRRTCRGAGGGDRQAGGSAHAAAQFRHASPRGRLRHPHRPRAFGTPRPEDDNGLHPRTESWRAWRRESGGQTSGEQAGVRLQRFAAEQPRGRETILTYSVDVERFVRAIRIGAWDVMLRQLAGFADSVRQHKCS